MPFWDPPAENYGFGERLEKRGDWKRKAAIGCVVLFIVHYFIRMVPMVFERENVKRAINQTTMNDHDLYMIQNYHYVFSMPILFIAAIIGKFAQCSFVLAEEFWHYRSRHDNSKLLLVKNCFQAFFTKLWAVGFGILVILAYWMWCVNAELLCNHLLIYWPTIITSVGVYAITNYIFGFENLSVVELSEIHESSSTNVAQGMAWSYFTGYLNIILPKLDTTINSSVRWKKELEQGNLQCKFFAIVPLDCKIPSKMGESEKHKGITFEDKLPTLYVDRAGVKERPYVNSVYKIENGKGESYYAICEYVTIIDTLYQMPLCIDIDTKTRQEQCRLLVRKLQELINENDVCKGRCEIVTLSGEDRPLLRDVLLDKMHQSKMEISG